MSINLKSITYYFRDYWTYKPNKQQTLNGGNIDKLDIVDNQSNLKQHTKKNNYKIPLSLDDSIFLLKQYFLFN